MGGFQLSRQDFRPEKSAMRLPLKGIINLLKRLTITASRQGLIFCLIWRINGVSGQRTVLFSMNMTCLVILQQLGTNAYSRSYSLKEPWALMSHWSDPELRADIGYQLLRRYMGYLLLLSTAKGGAQKKRVALSSRQTVGENVPH